MPITTKNGLKIFDFSIVNNGKEAADNKMVKIVCCPAMKLSFRKIPFFKWPVYLKINFKTTVKKDTIYLGLAIPKKL
jgi:hypothetical protein